MKLEEAARQLTTQFGTNVVAKERLADLGAYASHPTMLTVFRWLLKAGYGREVLAATHADKSSAIRRCAALSREATAKSGFKADLVAYAFDCLLYALGCRESVNEPFSRGYDPYSHDDDILSGLDGRLAALKKQYLDLLDLLPTLPTDLLHDAPGYYTAEALTTLYAVEAKIAAVEQQLSHTASGWCGQQLTARLDAMREEKSRAVGEVVGELKSQYTTLLEDLITTPGGCG